MHFKLFIISLFILQVYSASLEEATEIPGGFPAELKTNPAPMKAPEDHVQTPEATEIHRGLPAELKTDPAPMKAPEDHVLRRDPEEFSPGHQKQLRETEILNLTPVQGRFGVYKTEKGEIVRVVEAGEQEARGDPGLLWLRTVPDYTYPDRRNSPDFDAYLGGVKQPSAPEKMDKDKGKDPKVEEKIYPAEDLGRREYYPEALERAWFDKFRHMSDQPQTIQPRQFYPFYYSYY